MEKTNLIDMSLAIIRPSPMNPRKFQENDKFLELVASVREKGIIQPIVVRPIAILKGGTETEAGLEIVAGERRWRAACKVAEGNGGLDGAEIPAIVRDLTDDQAFDIMTIENLQREDLSEAEEAWGFKAFLDRKGEGALGELCDRTGIKPQYIRRRVHVLSLPPEVLKAWEQGKIRFGHLEQLGRLQDPKKVKEKFKGLFGVHWNGEERVKVVCTVDDLRHNIDEESVSLGKAPFYTSVEGCSLCMHNTAHQRTMFGSEEERGARCLDPKCFLVKVKKWLSEKENWAASDYRKKFGTNAGILWDWNKSGQSENFYQAVPKKECKACDKFVTALDQNNFSVDQDRVCLDPACFGKLYRKADSSGCRREKLEAKAAWRSEEHGRYFREVLFQERIPQLVDAVPSHSPDVDRLALVALLHSNHRIHETLMGLLPSNVEKDDFTRHLEPDKAWKIIKALSDERVKMVIEKTSLAAIMQPEFGHDGRYQVGRSLGLDLAKDWVINEEYLQRKTKSEILGIGEKFAIWSDPKVKIFLYEKLGLKRKKWEDYKKGELIRAILESGVNLAGKVPVEILIKEPACRVCGCTEDHACPGGCSWVEEDLCSVCAAKLKAEKKARRKK